MTDQAIPAIEQKLEETIALLKKSPDLTARRTLLAEIRILVAELEGIFLAEADSQSDTAA